MNIVFFGTGEFSREVAKAIIQSSHNILAIVTQPDKVNQRGKKIKYNALKQFAINNNIPVYQFEKLNIEGEQVLKQFNADFFVTASYGQIIKQNILDIPKYSIINVHASLLPKYRGPAPIQWAIINGETVTGVTIMKTELGLDCGEMYLKKKIDILPEDTSDSVRQKLSTLGGVAIVEFLDNPEYYISKAEKQDEKEASYYPMLTKEMSKIDFNTASVKLINLIRGQYSCNTMYFMHNKLRYKVALACLAEEKGIPGEVLKADSNDGLIIATADKSIQIITIQPEGKNEMSAKAFVNSGKIRVGDILN